MKKILRALKYLFGTLLLLVILLMSITAGVAYFSKNSTKKLSFYQVLLTTYLDFLIGFADDKDLYLLLIDYSLLDRKGEYFGTLTKTLLMEKMSSEQQSKAYQFLALSYYEGKDMRVNPHIPITQNYKEAAHWYEECAKLSNTFCQQQLAIVYKTGKGVDIDKEKAFQWMKVSAEAGLPKSQLLTGIMLLNGEGTTRSPDQAKEWLTKASNSGEKAADSILKNLEKNPHHIVYSDSAENAEIVESLANQNQPAFQRMLGLRYYMGGSGKQRNIDKALSLLEAAAAQGDVEGQFFAGRIYLQKDYSGRNPEKGFALIKKAAEANDSDAQTMLGNLYLLGLGTAKDTKTGYAWLEKAVAQENPDALFLMGISLITGKDIPKDGKRGIDLILQAAKKGNPKAREFLLTTQAVLKMEERKREQKTKKPLPNGTAI